MNEESNVKVRALFRTEIENDAENGFDRFGQVSLAAGVLNHLRNAHPDLWNLVYETRDIGALNERAHRGVREFKKLLEHVVRSSDESKDHRRTVSLYLV